MKKYYGYFGLALFMVFSFYYTEKIANIVLDKNPLMQEISKESNNYNIMMTNAIVNDKYIIPGLNGLEVNKKESFYNMQSTNVFNEYYLVFDQVVPTISLENNKDKIIKNGNQKKKSVSFIIDNNEQAKEYFKDNKLKASELVTLESYENNNYFENINNDVDNFKSLENTLNLNKENKNICVLNSNNKDICLKNKKYLIEPTTVLGANNYLDVKKNLLSGDIIMISDKASVKDIALLIKEIKYKDLKIIYLSEMISEKNN